MARPLQMNSRFVQCIMTFQVMSHFHIKIKYKEHLPTSKFQSILSLLSICVICYYQHLFSINMYLLKSIAQQNKINFPNINQHIVEVLIIIYFIFLNTGNVVNIIKYRSSHYLTQSLNSGGSTLSGKSLQIQRSL